MTLQTNTAHDPWRRHDELATRAGVIRAAAESLERAWRPDSREQLDTAYAFLTKEFIPRRMRRRRAPLAIYEALRCGLVHEYTPKVTSAFYFSFGDPLGLAEDKGALVFKIEPYFRHFVDGGNALRRQLGALANPEVPPAQTRVPWPARPAATVTPSS